MKCRDFEKEMTHHDFSQDPSETMKMHLESCSNCLILYKKQQSFFAGVVAEKSLQVSPFIATRVLAGLEPSQPEVFMTAFKPARVMAFAFAFVIGLGVAWMGNSQLEEKTASIILEDYFAESPAGYEIENSWINVINYEE